MVSSPTLTMAVTERGRDDADEPGEHAGSTDSAAEGDKHGASIEGTTAGRPIGPGRPTPECQRGLSRVQGSIGADCAHDMSDVRRSARLRVALDATPLLGHRTGVGRVLSGCAPGVGTTSGSRRAGLCRELAQASGDPSDVAPPCVGPAAADARPAIARFVGTMVQHRPSSGSLEM